MLNIPENVLREIYDHTEASYPNECCGLMVGVMAGNTRTVHTSRKCKNLNTDSEWDIIGIYHSHPDHPSRPSQTDTDRAWPNYSYVIISVREGKVASANSWVLNESERKFYEEPLVPKREEHQ
jgi:proteasome lid subunit RPN8/RPN11